MHAERRRLETRAGTRALGCYRQAILVLRWLLDGTRMRQLATDNAISRSTGYAYLHEGLTVLAALTSAFARDSTIVDEKPPESPSPKPAPTDRHHHHHHRTPRHQADQGPARWSRAGPLPATLIGNLNDGIVCKISDGQQRAGCG
ncbi:hypothetical protein Acsp02_92640 [Actinoplanes sp. NBRC 103695]|nr:hypothetical protein Acsp02_92640 [Actinoplanes sp. NBRC 103695]